MAILIIHSLAKREDLGLKISLGLVVLVSTIFIIIGYYVDQGDGWNISDSLAMSIVVFLMFVVLGICMEILLGLLLNSCVIVTEPAHECVSTGNVLALSGLASFLLLEVIAEFPGFEFGVIVGVGLVVLFAVSFGHKTENNTGDINSYFNKETMVKNAVFLEVKDYDL